MKREFTIYDTSSGSGKYVMDVKKEIVARRICREHNRNGERNYMYLEHYHDD